MCGVNAIVGKVVPGLVQKMNERLRHRGPDEGGEFTGRHFSLGSRRLKIIDLQKGQMPWRSACGRYHMVYNGEIYNTSELKDKLVGYPFESESDSEVLFALLIKFGLDALSYLNGMFSFAFYDEVEEKLLVGRDRMGIKPLFYAHYQGTYYFSSEIRPLLEIPGLNREIDSEGVYHYLSLLYFPEPFTVYKNIHRFPSACSGILKDGNLKIQSYWDLNFNKSSESEDELGQKIRETFDRSVKKRLISDVPLGVFLSGGIDSTLIATSASKNVSGPLNTYCLGFENGLDERALAQKTAQEIGSQHHSHLLSGEELWREIPEISKSFAEPFAGGLPMWFLSREVSQHVTVALCGTGGDEMFGNYGRSTHLKQNLSLLSALKTAFKVYGLSALSRPYEQRGAPLGHLYHEKVYPMREWQKRKLLPKPPSVRTDRFLDSIFWEKPNLALEDRVFYTDLKTQLSAEFLHSQDILSMSHHLEVRVPFLDHELVELMAQVPVTMRSDPSDPKAWMRKIFSDDLPEHILSQPKSGFSVPYGTWLKTCLKPMGEELLDEQRLNRQGIFNSTFVSQLWQRHQAGEDQTYLLWSILMFQLWFEQQDKNL